MHRDELLPGVTAAACPPAVSCDARAVIRTARRRAMFRDLLQIVVLLLIDTLFVVWPDTRLPILTRHETLILIRLANVIVLGDLFLSRLVPAVSARRIAATWSPAERQQMKKAG
jgi:hypothetical protein